MDIIEVIKGTLLAMGASSVMLLMLALSVVSIAVILERAWLFLRVRGDIDQLARSLDARLADKDMAGAADVLARSASVEASIAGRGLAHAGAGAAAVHEAIASGILTERARLERGLNYLGTLASNAPFIGLFGTVIGVILAFDELSVAGADGSASAAVMASIAEALVATAVGIGVAVPAVVAYNAFQARIERALDRARALEHLILLHLAATAQGQAPPGRSLRNGGEGRASAPTSLRSARATPGWEEG